MSTGTAKPTPSPPPERDWICELMPTTRPLASSSGPPELPRLIAASVWIAPVIGKSVSDSIVRSMAETTPTDSDCCSPNGRADRRDRRADLHVVATGASGSGRSVSPLGSTFSSATSALGS